MKAGLCSGRKYLQKRGDGVNYTNITLTKLRDHKLPTLSEKWNWGAHGLGTQTKARLGPPKDLGLSHRLAREARRKGRPEGRRPPYLTSSGTPAIPWPRPLSSSLSRAVVPEPRLPATQRAAPGRAGIVLAPRGGPCLLRSGKLRALRGTRVVPVCRDAPVSPPSWALPGRCSPSAAECEGAGSHPVPGA